MNSFNSIVSSRFSIYNSLFLNLPFQNISKTGNFLPLLQLVVEQGYEAGLSPDEIITKFFEDYSPDSQEKEKFDFLFRVIQYIERQVVLFDSIEDASFEQINDLRGKGSVAALLLRAETDGKREALRRSMDDFSIRVVLTAHPTQFYPGHLLAILTDLETAIRQNDLPQINLLLQQLGKTGFINNQKPTPFDEAVSLCWYLENIFYQAAPAIVYQLMKGLNITLEEWKNDRLITIGFWPGGDRDGNPFVTTPITLQVAQRLRHGIQRNYYQDVRQLKRRLTFEGVESLIQKIERKLYGTLYGGEAYKNAKELVDELYHIRGILIERHGGLFLDLLEQFILKVKIFGFHFTSLDIRQDGRKHESVLRSILEKNKKEKIVFDQPTDRRKLEELLKVSVDESSFSSDDPLVAETIASFKAIKVIQEQNGPQGCHRYVISNCQSALHIVQVYQLAKWLVAEDDVLPLDVVPLFESIEDLGHAQLIMEEIYQIPEYRRHIQQRGNKQTIMLGFSDGTKDGGYLRANWSIFRAKELLTEVSRKFGISALFFDGRGGPPARGGGNTHDFYASLGDSIENNEVQVTIQGQTISSNFGKVASCQYNLEQLLSAGLEGRIFSHPSNHLSNDNKKLLDQLAEAGHRSYLDLKLDAKFVPYLEKVTPLPFFGDTNIGSRPVKRSGDSLKFEDLRAIPFVGSWAQMKQNIPGFYGVGSALKELKDQGRWSELQALYKQSLFFRTLIGNSMMSLTKSFYPATAYLAQDKEFGDFWKKMFNEFELSIKMILDLSTMPELMENNPSIRESIKLREKIVLPLITVQQFALMALRNSTDKTNEQTYRKLIVRCMFGIINAARNSA